MSLTTEGVLFAIGALFLLIGVLGGGVEVSAIKVPTAGKLQRLILFGVGGALIVVGILVNQLNQPTRANEQVQSGAQGEPDDAPADEVPAQPAAHEPEPAADDDAANND